MNFLSLSISLLLFLSVTSLDQNTLNPSFDLNTEVAQAELAYQNLDGSSQKLDAYINQLKDVSNAMSSTSTVTINNTSYTKSSLNSYISSLEDQSEELSHQEDLKAASLNCEKIQSNASSISDYESFKACLKDLKETMKGNDTVSISGNTYTGDSLGTEIEEIDNQIDQMEKDYDMQQLIDKVETDTFQAKTVDDYDQLIDDYESVLDEMEDQDYNKSQTVRINNENMTEADIKNQIQIIKEDRDDLAKDTKIQNNVNAYEELLNEYTDVYGNVYTTEDQLESEIDHLESIYTEMESTETVNISGKATSNKILKNLIDQDKQLLEKLDNDDEVQVSNNGDLSFITEDEFEYRMAVDEVVKNIQNLTAVQNKTPEDLHSLSEAYYDLLDVMSEDRQVIINGDSFSYQDIQNLAVSTEQDAVHLKNQQIQSFETALLDGLYSGLGNYLTKNELNDLETNWRILADAMEVNDVVQVNNQNYTHSEAVIQANQLSNLISDMHPGQIYEITPNNEYVLITTPVIQNSSSLTSQDFADLVEGSLLYQPSDPVLSSNSYSNDIAADGVKVSIEQKNPITSQSFIQLSQTIQADSGRDYHKGGNRYILVSSFINDQQGTGKVFVLPKDSLSQSRLMIEGLDKPTGLCVDVNNDYLYVVDEGYGRPGGIYQYKVQFNYENLTVTADLVYLIYTGTPYDCKVDAFGNLYFTDSVIGSMNKVLYTDLYYGYSNTFQQLFTNSTNTPAALDLYQGSKIIYGSNDVNGSINVYYNSNQTSSELTEETAKTWGLWMFEEIAFYTLDSPEVKVVDLSTYLYETFQTEKMVSPKGLCISEGFLYVADYDAGVVFIGRTNEKNTLVPFAFVQAGYGCFCLNFGRSSAVLLYLSLGLLYLT